MCCGIGIIHLAATHRGADQSGKWWPLLRGTETGKRTRREQPGNALGENPVSIPGLDPQISKPSEGKIELHSGSSAGRDVVWSPVGDFTSAVGPYDPKSQRLYIWAYFSSGWIEIIEESGAWRFGDSGTVEPKLYYPADDIEDVTLVTRSEALEVQFYSGFTKPHWLSGNQAYRVYQNDGETFSRVAVLEESKLRYLGDDPIAQLAVFVPHDLGRTMKSGDLIWFDGQDIVDAPTGLERPMIWCHLQK